MPVTIKQIAKEAGVARSVVSAVVNDNYKYVRVSDEKRRVVRDIIKKHHYSPSAPAQILTSKKTGIINFLIPSYDYIKYPHNSRFIDGCHAVLNMQGYRLTFTSIADELADERYLKGIIADAFIVSYWGDSDEPLVRKLAATPLPLLVVRGKCPVAGIPNIYYDIKTAMYEVVSQLVAQGHRKVVFGQGYAGDVFHQEARRGVEQAVQDTGCPGYRYFTVPVDTGILDGQERLYDIGRRIAAKLMEEDAGGSVLMLGSDEEAWGAMDEARRRGMRIPDDLAVTGCGNIFISRTVTPAITTIERNAFAGGQEAGALVLEAIQGNDIAERTKIRMTPVFRASSCQKEGE